MPTRRYNFPIKLGIGKKLRRAPAVQYMAKRKGLGWPPAFVKRVGSFYIINNSRYKMFSHTTIIVLHSMILS